MDKLEEAIKEIDEHPEQCKTFDLEDIRKKYGLPEEEEYPAKTIYAFIAHQIDNIDAMLTSIDEMLESDVYTDDSAGTKIRYNDRYFNIINVSDTDDQENEEDAAEEFDYIDIPIIY